MKHKIDFDVEGWEFTAIGICGCGYGETIRDGLIGVLAAISENDSSNRARSPGQTRVFDIKEIQRQVAHLKKALSVFGESDLAQELVLHHLDECGLLEHGSSIGASWISHAPETQEIVRRLIAREFVE